MRTQAPKASLARRAPFASLVVAIALLTGTARADDASAASAAPAAPSPTPALDGPSTTPDGSSADDAAARHAIDRTWLYLDDARVAAPLTAVGTSNATYTSVGSSPFRVYAPYRPLAGNTAQPGLLASLGGEVGLLPRLSAVALGQMGVGGESGAPGLGAIAGLRLQLLPSTMPSTRLVASAGYLREAWAAPTFDATTGLWTPAQAHGDNGAWVQAAFAQDLQRLRLGTTVHAEHVFATGRDAVDVMVQLGASYRVAGGLRLGAEYVGQDLEEMASRDAEGGARHFIGPTASMQLLDDRLTVVAGPSVGLSAYSPAYVGRVAVAYGF